MISYAGGAWKDCWGLKFAAGPNEELVIIVLNQGEAGRKLTVKMKKKPQTPPLFLIICMSWNYVTSYRATVLTTVFT